MAKNTMSITCTVVIPDSALLSTSSALVLVRREGGDIFSN